MTSSFDCYKEYLALKQHFTKPAFDYHKYNGKVNARVESFDRRKDKMFFQKLAKHPDVHNFLLANLSYNEKLWIRDLAYGDDAERIYKDWLKKQQSLSYVFKQELSRLGDNFNDLFICKDNEHPLLMKKFLGNEVSLETLCILLKITKAKSAWDRNMQYDPIWDSLSTKVDKYTPFINFDHDKLKKIVIDHFSE